MTGAGRGGGGIQVNGGADGEHWHHLGAGGDALGERLAQPKGQVASTGSVCGQAAPVVTFRGRSCETARLSQTCIGRTVRLPPPARPAHLSVGDFDSFGISRSRWDCSRVRRHWSWRAANCDRTCAASWHTALARSIKSRSRGGEGMDTERRSGHGVENPGRGRWPPARPVPSSAWARRPSPSRRRYASPQGVSFHLESLSNGRGE